MAIPVVASVGALASANATSVATNAPSGVAVGDLLCLCAVTVSGLPTITTPTGWTSIASVSDGLNGIRASMYFRIADGTADDTPTVSASLSVNWKTYILRITGASTTGQPNTSATDTQTSTATPTVPSVTTTIANCLLITVCGSTGAFSVATPSTWTNRATFNPGTVSGITINSKDAASTGSYGGEAYATSPGAAAEITAAFKETAAAPSTDLMQGGGCGV